MATFEMLSSPCFGHSAIRSVLLGGKSVRAIVKEMSVLPLDAEADDLSKPNTE
jgi:hypothetical protein